MKPLKGLLSGPLMEIQSGEITGTYFSLPEGKPIVPFFYSKVIAEKMREKLLDAENWVVRGVSQYQLKGFVAQNGSFGCRSSGVLCAILERRRNRCANGYHTERKIKKKSIYINTYFTTFDSQNMRVYKKIQKL